MNYLGYDLCCGVDETKQKKTELNEQNILFIQGYATFGRNTYEPIENFFISKNFSCVKYNVIKKENNLVGEYHNGTTTGNCKVTFLQYKAEDSLEEIIKVVKQFISSNNFTHVIGHSMGGYITTQLLLENNLSGKNIILLQPLVYPYNNIINIFNYFQNNPLYNSTDDLIKKVPLGLIAPSSKLTYNTSLVQDLLTTDFYNLVEVNQLAESYYNMKKQDFSKTIDKYKEFDVKFMYASDELLNTLPDNVINELKKLDTFQIINSRHEPFNDKTIQNNISVKDDFFRRFDNLL